MGEGELVSLIGANGAGKTTTLKAVSGLIQPTAGRVTFLGQDITRASARRILALGMAHCPEGRRIFPHMSVRENLEMGCDLRSDKAQIAADLEGLLARFPILRERAEQAAGTLSGGEQQMLAISRALMSRYAEARRMRRMLEDLLWLARFDASAPPPAADPLDLTTLARQRPTDSPRLQKRAPST